MSVQYERACIFRTQVSHRGIEADTQKIALIIHMPDPTNKKELQRFLGMISYIGNFIPNL